MTIIDTFLNASKASQGIIIGIDFVVAVSIAIAIRSKNSVVISIVLLCTYALVYFGVGVWASYLPISYYVVLFVLPSLLLGLFLAGCISVFLGGANTDDTGDIFDVTIPYNNGKKLKVNIKRGVSVQGAAGSGKTVSIAGWILQWMGVRNVPGLVYDYKNFELVEAVQWFYRDSDLKVEAFAPHSPDHSVSINPIAPELLLHAEDVSLMAKCIVQNVLQKSNKGTDDNFFVQAAEGAIIGAIYVLRDKYPRYCTFPHLAALFLTKEAEDLVNFIERSPTASMHGRAFLDGKNSAKQMAGVKASLSNAFRVFAVPNVFYCMRQNSFPLNINNTTNHRVLCLVNIPKYDDLYSPILSIVAQATLSAMSERNQSPCYILLDEAPTLRINRIGRVPATMRSFNIATIYMLQDKIQAQVQMGMDKMKEVLSNLSTLFFGKTNDPETAKFFESYFETVKVKTKSTSKKAGWGSPDKRISEAEKDEKIHKSHEMFKRRAGEFFVFDEAGKNYDAKIKMPQLEPMPIQKITMNTPREIQSVFDMILKEAADL